MGGDHVVDQAAGGGLAALVQPQPGHHRVEVGPPDPGHEAGAGRDRHVAARRAPDQRQPPQQRRVVRHAPVAGGADRADAAGMRVDRGRAHRDPGRQAEAGRRLRRQGAHRRAHRPDRGADTAEALVGQLSQPDRAEVVLVPAFLVTEIGPLADGGAGGAGRAAGGPPGQVVRQVEEVRGAVPAVRTVPAQPGQLGRFHLERDPPADVAQHLVAARVDRIGLRPGAMVHPHDDVLLQRVVVVLRHRPDRDRAPRLVHHHERTGRVEADAPNVDRPVGGLRGGTGLAHRTADGVPDVRGRLLHVAGPRPPRADRVARLRQHPPVGGEQPGAGAAGTDVDAQHGVHWPVAPQPAVTWGFRITLIESSELATLIASSQSSKL